MAAQYKTKSPAFINDTMVAEGTVIEFLGEPGDNLEPMNDEARAAVEAAAAKRAAKAAAIKSALSGTLDGATAETVQTLITEVQNFAGRMAAAEARIAGVEAKAAPDLTGFATKADVQAVKTDVSELDQGLALVSDRVADVEGVLNTLAAAPAPAAPVEPPPAPPAEPTPAPVEQPTEPVAEQPATPTE